MAGRSPRRRRRTCPCPPRHRLSAVRTDLDDVAVASIDDARASLRRPRRPASPRARTLFARVIIHSGHLVLAPVLRKSVAGHGPLLQLRAIARAFMFVLTFRPEATIPYTAVRRTPKRAAPFSARCPLITRQDRARSASSLLAPELVRLTGGPTDHS
jgi:hypothetical protein